jgi:hypothetical protein
MELCQGCSHQGWPYFCLKYVVKNRRHRQLPGLTPKASLISYRKIYPKELHVLRRFWRTGRQARRLTGPSRFVLFPCNRQMTLQSSGTPNVTNLPQLSVSWTATQIKIQRPVEHELSLKRFARHRSWQQCIVLVRRKQHILPLQAWTGTNGSRWMRVPDFKTIRTWRW